MCFKRLFKHFKKFFLIGWWLPFPPLWSCTGHRNCLFFMAWRSLCKRQLQIPSHGESGKHVFFSFFFFQFYAFSCTFMFLLKFQKEKKYYAWWNAIWILSWITLNFYVQKAGILSIIIQKNNKNSHVCGTFNVLSV